MITGAVRERWITALKRAAFVKVFEFPSVVVLLVAPFSIAAIIDSGPGMAAGIFLVGMFLGLAGLALMSPLWLYWPLSAALLFVTNLCFPRRFLPSAVVSVAVVLIYGSVMYDAMGASLRELDPDDLGTWHWIAVAAANFGLVWLSYRAVRRPQASPVYETTPEPGC